MGVMGMLHAGTLNSLNNVTVTAVADTEKFVMNFLRKSVPQIKVYDNYQKMLNRSDLDLVYITTPVNSHIEIASYCAKNNLHFFIEKPLSRTSSECEPLCNILREYQVINMVGFYLRYSSTFLKAKELLHEKVIGEINKVNSAVFRSLVLKKGEGWRFKKELSGGGVLLDIGIILIDLLLWYFGKIKTVDATTEIHNMQEIEDSATASLTFESGMPCSFYASWNKKNYRIQETTIEIEGTLGKMKVNEDSLKIYYNDDKEKRNQNSIFYRQSLYKGVEVDIGGPMYTLEDLDFIKCINAGKQSKLNVINSSMTQSVADYIYKSSLDNQVEKVTYIE